MYSNHLRPRFTAPTWPLVALAGLLLGAFAWAQPEATFVRDADSLTGVEVLEAGYATITLINQAEQPYDLTLVRLRDGVTVEQFEEAAAAAQDGSGESLRAFTETAEIFGGVAAVAPGGNGSVGLTLVEGRYVGFSENFEGGVSAQIRFDVSGSNGAGAPDADLRVGMGEFTFDLDDEIPAGEQLWRVANDGEQPHHIAVFPIAPGTTLDDITASLSAPGEPSFVTGPPALMSSALSGGRVNDLTVDLSPGTYAAICFIPDADSGMPHAALGMVDVFTVVGD